MDKKVIQISSLTSEGVGIGSLDGLKVFVPDALPGEKIECVLVEKKKNYARGKLLSLLETTSMRTKAPCPYFGSCGGCNLMHVTYPSQLLLKQKRVSDALEKIGHFDGADVLPCLPSPNPLYYRNKIQLPVAWNQEGKKIGLFRKESHEIIPINGCMIQCPQGEEILKIIQKKLRHPSVRYVLIKNGLQTEESLVIFVTDGRGSKELKQLAADLLVDCLRIKGVVENINPTQGNVILGKRYRTLAGRPFIFEKLLNKTFKISPAAFFQVNPGQAEKLYLKAIELAEILPTDTVLDAYCGVGALALFASPFAKKVVGIEAVLGAIQDAKENSALNNYTNCTFFCGKAEELIENYPADVVFLNPPRKGCEKALIESVLRHRPRKIVYVSCDPATLARDLHLFSPTYKPQIVQPFDMFPQTMHVETVVSLSLRDCP